MKRSPILRLLVGGLVLVLAGLSWSGLRRPAVPPLPVPNGWEDVLAAQSLAPEAVSDWQRLELEELRRLVATNLPALALVRTGLTRECRMPLGKQESMDLELAQLGGLKRVAQAFAAESRLALADGRTNAAALAVLDCVRFSQESVRGGPVIAALVGAALRNLGLAQLGAALPSLDAATLRQLATGFEQALATRESAADVRENEARWVREVFSPSQRLAGWVVGWFQPSSIAAGLVKVEQSHQGLAQAMLDCAARAYELEHGAAPRSVADLVPAYLKQPPVDPVTGQPMPLMLGR